eukprot:gene7629-9386_t
MAKGKKKGQSFDDSDEELKNNNKKNQSLAADSDDDNVPQPVKKGQQKQQQNNNNKKGGKGKQQQSDDEVEDDIPQPVKKGQQQANKKDQKKGGKGKQQESDDEVEDLPQPVKKGQQQQKKGGKGKQQQESEDEEVEDLPQPVKKGQQQQQNKKDQKKGGKGKQQQESEDEQEEEVDDLPQPVKKGQQQNKKDQKKGGKGKQQESEDEEVEDLPQPVKKGQQNKKDQKKGGKGKQQESDDEEVEDLPQPVKKGQQQKKGGKGKQQESDDEEVEDLPQPVKKGQQQKKGGKGKQHVEEEEEEEIVQPVKKGGKKDKKKGGKGKQQESEEEEVVEVEEEEEEEVAQPVKKSGKKDKKKGGKGKQLEEEEEEDEEIEQPAKKSGKKDKKKGKQQEEEQEEEEIEKKMSDLSIKSKKKSKKGSKKVEEEEEEEEVVEEEVEEEEEEEKEEPKSMTLAEAKAAKAAKKAAKKDKKKEKQLKKRYQDDIDEDIFEKDRKKKEEEIDYDNVDFDDVPGRDPPDYVHLKSGEGMRSKIGNDIKIDNITLTVPGKTLLKDASLTLAYGLKYGFVGRNGIGKSTLVKKIANRDEVTIAPHLRVVYVEQEVTGDDNTPLTCVLNADIERKWLLEEEKVLSEMEKENPSWMYDPRQKRNYTLREIYDRLKEIDSDRAVTRASSILVGLGFTMEEISTKKSRDYSGGWRMRIALARALFCKPEILLLDEPSNHLDLHACVWLEKYLNQWDRTLLVVSHEATFLNEVVDNIIHIHNQRLDQYKGNYDDFIKQRDVVRRTQENKKDKLDRKKQKMKEFVSKNKDNTNAKKAANVKNQLNQLEEIKVDREDPSLIVDFPEPEKLTPPLLRFDDVSFGYEGQKTIFKNLDVGIDMDSKIALVGMNGVGKSTLMKLMSGELKETSGYVERSRKCRVARFSQHFVDQLITDVSPIEYFQKKFSNPPIQQIRNHLGRFGITGNLPLHKITTLSGGQKSRVILAELAWAHPHILLLDEPTNHLDIDAIEALAEGINAFPGGVVLISHNQHLINLVANEIWVVKKDGTVTKYDGDFMDYKEEISREIDSMIVRS